LSLSREQHTLYSIDSNGKDYYESDYIFTWEDGRPYTPDYYTKSFKKIVRGNASLDDSLTLHSLRASCVSIMAHNGEDPKNIQAYGGWSNIKTPMEIYVRTNREEMAAVTKRMGDCIIKSRNASVKVS
jgi:integrase